MRVVAEGRHKVTELHSEVVANLGVRGLALKVEPANASRETSSVSVSVCGGVCQLMDEDAEHLEDIGLHRGDENLMSAVSRCLGRVMLADGAVE